MIFSCSETWESEKNRLESWHPFFTLIPRTVGKKNGKYICAWLEWIERKGIWVSGWDWVYYYREKQ